MKKESEFLINKRVDHFEKWEGYKSKPKITLKKEVKRELQSTKRISSSNIVETPAVKQRRAQIKAVKDELEVLRIGRDTYIDTKQNVSARNRINELINAKKMLQKEVDVKQFVRY